MSRIHHFDNKKKDNFFTALSSFSMQERQALKKWHSTYDKVEKLPKIPISRSQIYRTYCQIAFNNIMEKLSGKLGFKLF
jgi:hypothetical protein